GRPRLSAALFPYTTLFRSVRSPGFLGACWEPGCGSLNPMKWLDALRRLACAGGARLYEGTRVTAVRRAGSRYLLITPNGTVSAEIGRAHVCTPVTFRSRMP